MYNNNYDTVIIIIMIHGFSKQMVQKFSQVCQRASASASHMWNTDWLLFCQITRTALCQADGTENEAGKLLHSDRQTQISCVHARASAHVAVAAYPALKH